MSSLEWALIWAGLFFFGCALVSFWALVAIWAPSDERRTMAIKALIGSVIFTVWAMLSAGIWTLLAHP